MTVRSNYWNFEGVAQRETPSEQDSRDSQPQKEKASEEMTKGSKSNRVEKLVESLSIVDSDPNASEAQARLREALTHQHWMPVEQAARLVAQYSMAGFTQELLAVWSRFIDPGAKLDPGCRAKESALVALDSLEWFDPDPFLTAIRYVQLEPGYGGSVDSAGGVRQRALFALLRQHHSQALLYAGEMLADPLVEVRVGTAEALSQYGGPNGAGLLVQRLRGGDDARVLLACASALLELEGPFARELLEQWLHQPDTERREIAALSLGQCRSGEAGEVLIKWFDEMSWDRDFELGARALAMHRSERARRCLLQHIATGSAVRAQFAIKALALHRYDDKLVERVRDAAKRSPHAELLPLVEEMNREKSQ